MGDSLDQFYQVHGTDTRITKQINVLDQTAQKQMLEYIQFIMLNNQVRLLILLIRATLVHYLLNILYALSHLILYVHYLINPFPGITAIISILGHIQCLMNLDQLISSFVMQIFEKKKGIFTYARVSFRWIEKLNVKFMS